MNYVSFRQICFLVPFSSLNRGFLTKLWISVCATGITDDFLRCIELSLYCLFGRILSINNVVSYLPAQAGETKDNSFT